MFEIQLRRLPFEGVIPGGGSHKERLARMILFVTEYHEEHWARDGLSTRVLIRKGIEACTDSTLQERELVYFLCMVAWNDSLAWANQVLENIAKATPNVSASA